MIRQDGDSEDLIQEAIETCPVNCIHWVEYEDLKLLEDERQYQTLQPVGMPCDPSLQVVGARNAKLKRQKKSQR